MLNSNPNSIAQCDNHNMFICPNLNNIENEDLILDSHLNDEFYDQFGYEDFDMFRNNASDLISFEEDELEDDFHYNLMNRKSFNPHNRNEDLSTMFSDPGNLSSNMQREINRIVRRIEVNNPEIFRFLTSRRIPLPVARRLVRRIVVLTLLYSDCKF